MLRLPPVFVRNLVSAVQSEVSVLEELARTVGQGDDKWPDDYDPNDLAYYRGALLELAKSVNTGMNIDDPSTRPVEALMKLIPHYVRTNHGTMSDDDLALTFRVYTDYVASVCLTRLPHILESPKSSYVDSVRRMLSSLVEFPRPERM